MGWPSTGKEALYRNPATQVKKLLQERHGGTAYAVYNLCSEREYLDSLVGGVCVRFPFDDHNAPSLQLIKDCCEHMEAHLKADAANVCAVHCKAGKGRTGTLLCAYMVHSGQFSTAEEAMLFYGDRRTHDGKGVTIPSQRRYVRYYERMCREGLRPPPKAPVLLKAIVVSGPRSLKPAIRVMQRRTGKTATEPVVASGDAAIERAYDQGAWLFVLRSALVVEGDVRVQLFRGAVAKKNAVGSTWLQTGYEAVDALRASRAGGGAEAAAAESGGEIKGAFTVRGRDIDKADKALRDKGLAIKVCFTTSYAAFDPPAPPWDATDVAEATTEDIPVMGAEPASPRADVDGRSAPPVFPEPTVPPKPEPDAGAGPASPPHSARRAGRHSRHSDDGGAGKREALELSAIRLEAGAEDEEDADTVAPQGVEAGAPPEVAGEGEEEEKEAEEGDEEEVPPAPSAREEELEAQLEAQRAAAAEETATLREEAAASVAKAAEAEAATEFARQAAAAAEENRIASAEALAATERALAEASSTLSKEQGSFVSKLRLGEAQTAEANARAAALASELKSAVEEAAEERAGAEASAAEAAELQRACAEAAAREGTLLKRVADLEADLAGVRATSAEASRERAAQEAEKAAMRSQIDALTESVAALEVAAAKGTSVVVQGVEQEVHDEVMGALRESIGRMQSLMEALKVEQDRNAHLNGRIQALIADVVAGEAVDAQALQNAIRTPAKALPAPAK